MLINDSIAAFDTLVQAIQLPVHPGMEGILRTPNAGNEPWVFITLTLLFVLLAFAFLRSEGVVWENLKAFFSVKKKLEHFTPRTGEPKTYIYLIRVFSISVLALMAYQILHLGINPFNLLSYLYIIAFFIAYFTIKHIVFRIIGNTFFGLKEALSFTRLYFSLVHIYAISVFPLLILYVYQPAEYQIYLLIISAAILLFLYILLIIKIFQVFYIKGLALFYIFLYLCTLEILPVLALFRIIERFIIFV